MKHKDKVLPAVHAGTARSWLRHRLRELVIRLAPADSLRQQRWRLLARSGRQAHRARERASVHPETGR